ncbi:MAG: hypothetical protein LBV62_03705 [Rickettsiales bacterium]|jgi:hypothetical protein|nr:hypothetical protein [Rickettsiales bacterium]
MFGEVKDNKQQASSEYPKIGNWLDESNSSQTSSQHLGGDGSSDCGSDSSFSLGDFFF